MIYANVIHRIMCNACMFYYYLTCTNGIMDGVSQEVEIKLMELKELKQPDDLVASDKPLAIEEDILLPKTGNNLIENYIATIAVHKVLEAMYRMTLDSTSNIHLYPIIFYFDPTTLSISGWFFT